MPSRPGGTCRRHSAPTCSGASGRASAELEDEFAQLETLDNGKPIAETHIVDIPLTSDLFRYYAGWVTKIEGQVGTPSFGKLPHLHAERARRSRRRHHPVELPAAHVRLQARALARGRLHGRAEARGADAALGASSRRGRDRGRVPAGRGERGDRLRGDVLVPRSPATPTSTRSPSPASTRPARRSSRRRSPT